MYICIYNPGVKGPVREYIYDIYIYIYICIYVSIINEYSIAVVI
jgi:hypothetical protein